MIVTHRREHLETESVLVLVRLLDGDVQPDDSREDMISRLLGEAQSMQDEYGTITDWPVAREYVLEYETLNPSVDFQVVGEGSGWFRFQRYVINPKTETTWIDCYGGSGSGQKAYVQARAFRPDRLKRKANGQIITRKHRSHVDKES